MKRLGVMLLIGAGCLYAQANLLTEEDAIRHALANHVGVQKSASQVRLAEQEALQQRGVMLPSLSLNSDLSRPGPNLRQDPWLNPASRSQYETVWRTNLQAKWTLFDGGGNAGLYESRKILVDAAKQREQSTKESVMASVALAYWDLVKQNQLVALARSSREFSNERLRIAQARRAMGSASQMDEQQAMLDRNADSAAELRQVAAQQQARRLLNWWMGKPLEDSLKVAESFGNLSEKPTIPTEKDSLSQKMPQIREAQLRKESAQAAVSATRGEWFPEVSLYANYNFLEQYSDKPPPGNGHYQGMLYGVQLTMPIYEGGRSVSRIVAAQETERTQTLAVREIEEIWTRDVAFAEAQLNQALALADLERGNAKLADSLHSTAFRQFELGSLSGIDLRRVQLSRTEAQERLVLAEFSEKTAVIQLKLLLPKTLP